MESILMTDILCKGNRKYTDDPGFPQFVESVRELGIIEPIVVRRREDGGKTGAGYLVVAGRRRYQAAAELRWERIDCVVREDDTDDDELALAENVNRLGLHPLDEADAFGRMRDSGAAVEEIARYYNRSPSAIRQRIRLRSLGEGARGMFSEGRLDLTGAVMLSGLPAEDQEKFAGKYAGKKAGHWQVQDFILKAQKSVIAPLLGEACEGCAKRTRNGDPGLFEEEFDFDDVCLDRDCYAEKWHGAIEKGLGQAVADEDRGTDRRIYFGYGIPAHLYKLADGIEFFGSERYEVVKAGKYDVGGETRRKKNTAWKVTCFREALEFERIAVDPAKKQGRRGGVLDEYDASLVTALAEAAGGDPETLAAAMKEAGLDRWAFSREISKRVRERVTERNLAAKPRDYADIFTRHCYGDDNPEFEADLQKFAGVKSAAEIKFTDKAQRFFQLLLEKRLHGITDLDALAHPGYDSSLFWEYAGMDEESYRALYLEEARAMGIFGAEDSGKAPAGTGEEDGGEPPF